MYVLPTLPDKSIDLSVYSPVSMGRKAIGIELKDTYFRQAIENMKLCKNRFADDNQIIMEFQE